MKLKFPLIAVGILVFSMLKILGTDGQSEANFKKAVCKIYDEQIFTNYSCSSKPINRYKTVLNVFGHLSKRLDHMLIHHQLYKKFNVIYRPFLINVTENFCLKYINKSKSPYLNILMDIGQKYSNLNHTCPYEGWLIIKNLELDLSSIRLVFPEGEYRYDIEPIINRQPSPGFNIQIFFEITGPWKKKN